MYKKSKFEIKPRIEILYKDLLNLRISDFLVSREFKKLLISTNLDASWAGLVKQAEGQRTYFALGLDHDKIDSESALIPLLNICDEDESAKTFIGKLIIAFIKHNELNCEYDNLIDSLQILNFNESLIKNVTELVSKKKKESIPKKEPMNSTSNQTSKKQIFLVHGHNDGILQTVARVLEKQNIEPTILREQPSEGLTIIEKFEANAATDFAVIILTADDVGNRKDEDVMNKRARQNVIFEMGYFFALLGRKNVVCLYEDGVELPSDIGGRMYISLSNPNDWKLTLLKELRNAGFDVTADKL